MTEVEVKAIWTSDETDMENKAERHNIIVYDGHNKPYIKIISYDDDSFEVIEYKRKQDIEYKLKQEDGEEIKRMIEEGMEKLRREIEDNDR